MPAILLMMGAGIKYLMAYAVFRFALAVGLSYVTYQGMDVLFSSVEAEIMSYWGQVGAGLYDILMLMGADVAFSILLSAVTIRLMITGWSAGVKSGIKISTGQ